MSEEAPPTYWNVTESHLRKIFEETKSRDLTHAQFEREKTERMTALCDLLKTAVGSACAADLLRALHGVIASKYEGHNWNGSI